jgi:hypothetical protein
MDDRTRRQGMRMSVYLTSAWLTLLASIVLAQSVTYDYDRAVDFSKFKTYAWTRGRVVRAIDAALAGKGLAKVEPSANPRRACRLRREF